MFVGADTLPVEEKESCLAKMVQDGDHKGKARRVREGVKILGYLYGEFSSLKGYTLLTYRTH